MDLKQIECFIAVAEELNFTSAAKKLYISQPSLSRKIHDLEMELGLELFYRNKKKVSLTESGVFFLPAAKELIGKNNEILDTARRLSEGLMGRLKIGYQGSARSIIPQYLSRFNENYQNILVSIEQHGAISLLKKVDKEEIDIAFAFSIIRENNPYSEGLRSKLLKEDTMCIFTSQKKFEQITGESEFTLENLNKETFIQIDRMINPGYFEILHNLYLRNNFYPSKIIEARTLNTLLLMIEANMGISLLPLESIKKYNANIRYLKTDFFDENLPIEVFWKKENTNPSLQIFLENLKKQQKNCQPLVNPTIDSI